MFHIFFNVKSDSQLFCKTSSSQCADEANVLEEEIAHRIAIKFLVEDDASEKKKKFIYAQGIVVEGPGECSTLTLFF